MPKMKRFAGIAAALRKPMAQSASIAKCTARLLLGAILVCAACTENVGAQTAQPLVATRVPMPDNAKITLLIQMHIAALSQANLTGNYSVLHSLASPSFQAVNSTAQLASNFATFRSQGIDISPTILLPPMLIGPPKLEGADLLRVSGQYDTKPHRVVFEMAFQAVNNAWRLAGISVNTVAANQAALRVEQPAAATQPPKAARLGNTAKQ
jgi:hypothetical protein